MQASRKEGSARFGVRRLDAALDGVSRCPVQSGAKSPHSKQCTGDEAEAFALALATKRPLLVLVTGAREWADPEPIRRELRRLPADSIVLHGNARGVDLLAGQVAAELGLD